MLVWIITKDCCVIYTNSTFFDFFNKPMAMAMLCRYVMITARTCFLLLIKHLKS